MEKTQVAIWHDDIEIRNTLRSAVVAMGHEVASEGQEGDDLVAEATKRSTLGLIICALRLGAIDAVDCLVAIAAHRTVPAVVIARDASLGSVDDALRDHVMAYLLEPVRECDIRPTVHLVLRRFREFQSMRNEICLLKTRLADRKTIEQAKGIIMGKSDVDEATAYQWLRKTAMDQRIRLLDAARRILCTNGAKRRFGSESAQADTISSQFSSANKTNSP